MALWFLTPDFYSTVYLGIGQLCLFCHLVMREPRDRAGCSLLPHPAWVMTAWDLYQHLHPLKSGGSQGFTAQRRKSKIGGGASVTSVQMEVFLN